MMMMMIMMMMIMEKMEEEEEEIIMMLEVDSSESEITQQTSTIHTKTLKIEFDIAQVEETEDELTHCWPFSQRSGRDGHETQDS